MFYDEQGKIVPEAACSSELQIERDAAIADFQQFCSTVERGATMG
jgi:hypothetical protein